MERMMSGGHQNPPRLRGGEPRSGGGGYPSLRRREVYSARKLRREMSLPEVLVWQQLKNAKQGFSFRKQHPIGPYVADFYYAGSKLVVEIGGQAHSHGDRPEKDILRDKWMIENGYFMLRFSAQDVLNNMEDVIQSIVAYAASPLHHSSNGPHPRAGEDL
jgi:very-short-patch-repair endonuclease